ncbi:hypothetical protein FW774_18510 [Pedobacter sp. BS3]|uniref:hypothetical protein n=1 Tax=Pedobacter sp. BS3 TaxID=2567937 RepID=UPI0011EE9E3B|nr:hypothetical protein [Pedobacter sp. BS3]TZF81542.1 hypothetical protein FW774_18510 [Pedobacter sp. BS3]
MKTMTKFIPLCIGVCITMLAKANIRPNASHPSKAQAIIDPSDVTGLRPATLGLSLGFQGIGIESYAFLGSRWQLHAGASYLPFQGSKNYLAFPSRAVSMNLNANIAQAHLLLDFDLFPNAYAETVQNIALSAGISYFVSAKGTAKMKLKDPYYYGDIQLSPDEVGELTAESNWKGFAPYVGLALNNLRISNRVGLNIGVGTFYLASPSVKLNGTNYLADNYQNQQQLKHNLDKYYRWMPSFQVTFNYSLINNIF